MKDRSSDARPVPLPAAVHDLIRQVAPERASDPDDERYIIIDGMGWVVRIVGGSVGGSGELGSAYLVVIRFQPVATPGGEEPGEAPREVLLPRGRFEYLYDEELIELFRRARPVST